MDDELLTEFLIEVNEGLAELDTALVTLERVPDDQPTLALIFRQVHTIKGTCGFLGLPRLERVAHAAEDVLGRLRDGTLAPTAPVIDQVLASLDRIRAIVASLDRTGEEPAGDDAPLLAALGRIAAGDADAASSATQAGVEVGAGVPVGGGVPVGAAVPATMPAPARPDAAPSGTDEADGPSRPDRPEDPARRDAPAFRNALAATDPGQPAPAANENGAAAAAVRVGVDTLEQLMTLAGELVLTRNQLTQLTRGADASPMTAPVQRLSRLATELQDVVMKTRMQPIGSAWNKLPRLVRDLSHELGKPIELVMLGAETELDRQVLEQIRDPLTHIVRNSADHGLETASVRRAAGKPECGHIVLKASHESGHVVIEVRDDGRGLDLERIRARIVARGLATEAELAAMTERQIQQYIFVPGFSTAEAVTSVSGRGVGMDVVRSNIERISGTVELASVPGEGTTISIRIPLTLAIVPGLVVQAAGQRFVLPQLAVAELVRAGTGPEDAVRVEPLGGGAVLRLRDALLPLVDLAALLGLAPAEGRDARDQVIIVTRAAGAEFGLTVDTVFDTEEIVVKPVAPPLRHLLPFGGTTILGDGTVTMILDPIGVARAAAIATHTATASETPAGNGAASSEASLETLLLFQAGGAPMAVPLAAVTRLETVAGDHVETSGGRRLVQYRGSLMPLIPVAGMPDRPLHDVLVLQQDATLVGVVVDAIVDIVEAAVTLEMAGGRPGVVGTAVIAGRATELIDPGHYIRLADDTRRGATGRGGRVAKNGRKNPSPERRVA